MSHSAVFVPPRESHQTRKTDGEAESGLKRLERSTVQRKDYKHFSRELHVACVLPLWPILVRRLMLTTQEPTCQDVVAKGKKA